MSGIQYDYGDGTYKVSHFGEPTRKGIETMEEACRIYKAMSGVSRSSVSNDKFSLRLTTTDTISLCGVQRNWPNPFLSKKGSFACKEAARQKRKKQKIPVNEREDEEVVVTNIDEEEEELEKRLLKEEMENNKKLAVDDDMEDSEESESEDENEDVEPLAAE